MTNEELVKLFTVLRAAAPQTEVTEDMLHLWGNVFSGDPFDDCIRAAERWVSNERWFPTPAEFKQSLREVRNDGRRQVNRRALPGLRCDGHGWVVIDGESKPCPTCSPALAVIDDDPTMFREWNSGIALHDIFGMDKKEFQREWERPPCRPGHHDDAPLSLAEGKAVARQAYIADCEERGVEPRLDFFDSVFQGITS